MPISLRWEMLLLLAVAACPANFAQATTIAFDDASDAAYAADASGAWLGLNPTAGENPPGSDNGGYGFEPWDFTGGYHVPQVSPYGRLNHFIDGRDFAASTFNDLGAPAFGLTNGQASGHLTAAATRPFASPMQVGDMLSFDFDTPAEYDALDINQYPFVIFTLLDDNGGVTLRTQAGTGLRGDTYNWEIQSASGKIVTNIAPDDTSDGSRYAFTLSSETSGVLELDGQMFEVDLKAGVPAAIRFTLTANKSGDGSNNPTGERELFFNNILLESPVDFVPGDFNGDGMVNIADYTRWRNSLGGPDSALAAGSADASSDTVDAADYALWKSNFGTIVPAAQDVHSVSVPEGSTMALLSVAVLLTTCCWRRGCK